MTAGDHGELGTLSVEVEEMRQKFTLEPFSVLGYLDGLDNLIW